MPLEIILCCPVLGDEPHSQETYAEACLAYAKANYPKSPWSSFLRGSMHILTPTPGPVNETCWAQDEAFWKRMDDQHLMKEYLEMQRASLNRMFGQNACQARVRIARQLQARGITHIPNIFGSIAVD